MELGQRVEVSLNGQWHDATIETQTGKQYGVRVDGYKELLAYGDPEQISGAGEFLRPAPEDHSSAGCGHDHQTAEEINAVWRAGELNTLSSPPAASSAEVRVVSSTGGEKGKKKDRYDLIPAEALRKVAELYGIAPLIGKYEDRNWERGYDWSLSFAALQRHIWQFWGGEDKDEETGMEHVACAIFHALALLTFMEEHPEFDDRPSTLKSKK